jgi:hypothetical protein
MAIITIQRRCHDSNHSTAIPYRSPHPRHL